MKTVTHPENSVFVEIYEVGSYFKQGIFLRIESGGLHIHHHRQISSESFTDLRGCKVQIFDHMIFDFPVQIFLSDYTICGICPQFF